jgi:peptidyl-prolyl cis-trans isomerase C
VRKDIVIAVVSVVVIAALTFGLAALSRDVPLSPSRPFASAEKGSGAARKVAADDKVVMRVNGEPITEREFYAFLESAPDESRPFYASPAGRQLMASELVRLKVLEQEAHRRGLVDTPEVQMQIEMARAQITAGVALQKLVEERSREKLQAEYEKERGTSFSLRHILVAYQGGAVPARGGQPAPLEAEAMRRAQQLVARIRGGAEFEQVASTESDDEESAANGGMLGPARPEMLPEDIAPVVSRLQPGQVSDPVRTQFGIHIFKIEEPSLEDLQPVLLQRVRQQAAQEEIERLQKAAKVDLDPAFFPEQRPHPANVGQPPPQ